MSDSDSTSSITAAKLAELSSISKIELKTVGDIALVYEKIGDILTTLDTKQKSRLQTLLQTLSTEENRRRINAIEDEEETKRATSKEKQIERQLKLAKESFEEKKKSGLLTEEQIRNEIKKIQALEKQLKLEKDISETRRKGLEDGSKLLNSMTAGLNQQFLNMFKMDGFANSLQDRTKKILDLQKQTAAIGQDFNFDMSTFGRGMGQFGITQLDFIDNFKTMRLSMTGFTDLSKDMQDKLTQNASKMKNFDISIETSAKNFDTFTKGLGVGVENVEAFSDELVRHALGAGIAPKKMVEEFQSAMPKLAAYGEKAKDVFIGLQKQAKSLGMEMQSLTSIVGDQFDTFEGSAKAAGKLNAILGGNYLNSVEMLNATEEERTILIQQAMEASGKQYDAMDKMERKALAATLNITNQEDANKMFGSTSQKLQEDMNKQAVSTDALSQQQKKAADTNKILESSYDSLNQAALMGAKATREAVNAVNEYGTAVTVVSGIVASSNIIMGISGLIPGLVSSLGGAKEKVGGFFSKMLGGFKKVAETAPDAADGIKSTGGAANSSTGPLLALGGAIALIGVGIFIASIGLAELVKAFSGLNKEQIDGATKAITIFSIAIVVIVAILAALAASGVGPAAAGVLKAIGVGFALIGLGIGIASVGMSFFVKSLKEIPVGMGTELLKIAQAVGILSLALAAGAGAAIASGISGAVSGVTEYLTGGRVTMSIPGLIKQIDQAVKQMDKTSLDTLSGVLYNLKTAIIVDSNTVSSAEKMTTFLSNLNSVFSNTLINESARSISEAIKEIGKAMNEIPSGKRIEFETFTQAVTQVKTVTEADLKPTKDFVAAMERYYAAQSTSKDAEQDALVNALEKILSQKNGETQSVKLSDAEVNLVIKGDDFVKAIRYGDTTIKGILTGLK